MYEITYRTVAIEEYADATKWYAERSQFAAEKFVQAVEEKLDSISCNPKLHRNLHKNYYEVSTRKYP